MRYRNLPRPDYTQERIRDRSPVYAAALILAAIVIVMMGVMT